MEKYFLDKKEDLKNINVLRRDIDVPLTKEFIITVVGPRRAGKSYLLYSIIKEKKLRDRDYIYINFEEIQSYDFVEKHIEIYGIEPKYIFLDEVHALKDWQRIVYRLFEKKRYFIFVTGSSSKLLSKEIATQLRGRTLTIPVLPFSFKEIIRYNKIDIKKHYSSSEESKIKNILVNYMLDGGFPLVVLNEIKKDLFFRDYIDLVIVIDIMERYDVKESSTLRKLVRFIATSFGNELSINKIYNTFKSEQIPVSKKTLYSYTNYLEDVFLIFLLKKYSTSERKIETSHPKVYFSDTGLVSHLILDPENSKGRLMENIVYLQLKRMEFLENMELFFFKSSHNYEVDFLISSKNKISELIQVTYASSYEEIPDREIRALLHAKEDLKLKDDVPLTVITWDYEDEKQIEWWKKKGKIRFIPLWKFLIQ